MTDVTDALSGAAKGAAAGAFLGPVGAALGGVLGAAPGLLDLLGVHLFGANGEQVAQAAQAAVSAAVGKPDPTAAEVAGLAPDKMAALRVSLAQIAAQQESQRTAAANAAEQTQLDMLKAQLADIANARSQTVSLAQAGSAIAWGAVAVSVIVLAAFALVCWVVLTRALPTGSDQAATLLLGALSAMGSAVVSYWVGSSAGSAHKTALLADRASKAK